MRSVLVCGVLSALAVAAGPRSNGSPMLVALWPANGGTAQVTAEAASAQLTATAKLRLDWRATLDGGVIASPIAYRSSSKGTVVIASTETGSVYALGKGGATIWRTHLGSLVAGSGCGTYGVSSTPALDLARGLVYVANADGMVHALRLSDGGEAPGWPVKVVSRVHTEYVWGGLRLVGSRLYVAVASYCDAVGKSGNPAEGGLLALDVTTPTAAPLRFDPVPGPDNLGGIWGWGGVSVAQGGAALYTGIGNAEPDVPNGYSDSMVELTPDLSTVVGSYRPTDAAPGKDIDFGSAPVLFQPKGCAPLLAANDKDGTMLVWKQGAVSKGPVAVLALNDGVVFVGAPSWSPTTQMLYDGGTTAVVHGKRVVGTTAIAVKTGCTFAKRWFEAAGAGTEPQPLVAGGLVFAAGGDTGGFSAYRAGTGVAVWHYPTGSPAVSPLILAGSDVVGGDDGGDVYAFSAA